jgi:hypothetical protein
MNENLTNAEFADFNGIVTETINKLIACADKHNIDRDSFIKYFAAMFGTMAEITTFEHYKEGSKTDE